MPILESISEQNKDITIIKVNVDENPDLSSTFNIRTIPTLILFKDGQQNNVIDNLYKAGVSDISIVEDFTETLIENDDELVNQAEDTMTILGKYIDNLTLNVDNDKLKALMKEVYVEALTTETE